MDDIDPSDPLASVPLCLDIERLALVYEHWRLLDQQELGAWLQVLALRRDKRWIGDGTGDAFVDLMGRLNEQVPPWTMAIERAYTWTVKHLPGWTWGSSLVAEWAGGAPAAWTW